VVVVEGGGLIWEGKGGGRKQGKACLAAACVERSGFPEKLVHRKFELLAVMHDSKFHYMDAETGGTEMLAGTDLGTGGLGHVGAPPKTATGVAKEEGSLMAGSLKLPSKLNYFAN